MKHRRWIVGLVIAAVALAGLALARPALAAPSLPLARALSSLRGLSDAQFGAVMAWSRTGTPPARPSFPFGPTERAEIQLLDLPPADRMATLQWLRGNGRGALYARGATDDDIGPRRPQNWTPAATPTPNPYRLLTFASATLGNKPVGEIAVLGGFAAVKRDGRGAVICISFKNLAAKVARRVVFDFPLHGNHGGELGELQLDRNGEFSPGIDINGWPDLSGWQSGIGHRGYNDNCTSIDQRIASRPLLDATEATYRLVRVDYTDGTSWTPATP